jgi:hypothetical protein
LWGVEASAIYASNVTSLPKIGTTRLAERPFVKALITIDLKTETFKEINDKVVCLTAYNYVISKDAPVSGSWSKFPSNLPFGRLQSPF